MTDDVQLDDTSSGESGAAEAEPEQKRFKFPTALTVLGIVLLVVWVASFFIPSGLYDIDPATGDSIPGSYHELPSCSSATEGEPCSDKSVGAQFQLLWRSPPYGLYGLENDASRTVGVNDPGFLYGSAQIFLFVLAVGAFITMAMSTGAIEAGISRLALRFRASPILLIVVLMSVFALGGTSYGMWEETLGFFALMVPLALALGYDRMTAVAIIFLGAGTGVLCSTVNPFATGVASDAAGISITDGIGLRLVMLFVLVPMSMAYVIWYSRRVKADPMRSLVYAPGRTGSISNGAEPGIEAPPLTGRQKVVLVLFGLAFVIMIYGFIPWNDLWQTIFDRDFPLPTFSDFYFTEASVLFIVMAIIIAVVSRYGEEKTVSTLVSGAADFLTAGLVIVLARGITVVMKNTYITDTILHWMENAVQDLSGTMFGVMAWVVNIPIAILVPSSSGHAALVMPILAPLAGFAGVPEQVVVTAYQSASGWVNLITPTSAVIMGGLTLAKVGYDRFLRFVVPYLVVLFVVVTIFVAIGATV